MNKLWLLIGLAVIGLGLAAVAVFQGNQPAQTTARPMPDFQPPFASRIAGTGVVEAATGNIDIGTRVPGVVTEIDVAVGDAVRAGDPLFRIDDSELQARKATADARVAQARAALQLPAHQLEFAQGVRKENADALSLQDLTTRRDEYDKAEKDLALAQAEVEQLRQELARYVVRAPVNGEILQLRMRVGEYVDGAGGSPPLLVLGGDDRWYLRVNVDEHEAWRYQAGAAAEAFVRGRPELHVPLSYEYLEPLMVPKPALSGISTERTDTRVLQVLYSFPRDALPVYVGQLLDVYLEAPDNASSAKGS